MSESKILKYKQQLENTEDVSKLRHILKRLENVDMTMTLLSSTGIGKAVNGCSGFRHDDDLDSRSKVLVKKWKSLAENAMRESSDQPAAESSKKSQSKGQQQSSSNGSHSSSNEPCSNNKIKQPEKRKVEMSKEKAFTAESGMGFADILAMPVPVKQPVKKPKKAPLNEGLLSMALPKIAPNYKPNVDSYWDDQGGQGGGQRKKDGKGGHGGHQEMDLAEMIKSKKTKTQVFAGRKSQKLSSVPTLFDASMRILADNPHVLLETGDVPYDILKPALERAPPELLNLIEINNPYVAHDSDELWKVHCKREFRDKYEKKVKADEQENSDDSDADDVEPWKEYYNRMKKWRDEKLIKVSARVNERVKDVAVPTRVAKTIAVAKSPHHIRKKQIRNGVAVSSRDRVLPTPQEIVQARRDNDQNMEYGRGKEHITHERHSSSVRDSAIFRPSGRSESEMAVNPTRPERSGAGGGGKKKPAKAPMMAKLRRQIGRKR